MWSTLHTLNNSRRGASTLHFLQTAVRKLPPSNWGALSTPASTAGADLLSEVACSQLIHLPDIFTLDWMSSVRELQWNISLCCQRYSIQDLFSRSEGAMLCKIPGEAQSSYLLTCWEWREILFPFSVAQCSFHNQQVSLLQGLHLSALWINHHLSPNVRLHPIG